MNEISVSFKFDLFDSIRQMALTKMNEMNETEKRKLSHRLEDMMPSCSFNKQSCSVDDFQWTFDPWYGNCWLFNAGPRLNFNRLSGITCGLRMDFYVNFYENLTEIHSYNNGLGAMIRIDNSSYMTMYNPDEGIRIEPGHATSVSVSRSFKTSLSRPYSNCLIDNETNAGFHSELFDLIQNSAYKYTQPICFLQCQQRIFLLNCNCKDPSF